MNLAEKIQQLRRQNHFSQEHLADKLGVSRQSVSKWESGQSVPEIDKIVQLSDIFGVTIDYLVKNIECKSDNTMNSNTLSENSEENRFRLIFAVSSILFSAISIFVIWLLSKIYPSPVSVYNPATKKWFIGLSNFLIYHELMFFYYFCWILGIVGIVALFFNQIKYYMLIIQKRFGFKN